MKQQTRSGLVKLQRLDDEIREAKTFLADFEPMLEEVEAPALELQAEVERTRSRLQEMRLEERRLEVTTKEKENRVEKLKERLNQVRNVREESAVNAELDMVRSALESDEQEAYSLIDQIRKFELRLEEEESAYEKAKEEVEPRQQELLEKRETARTRLLDLEEERVEFARSLVPSDVKVYDAIHSGGRRTALAQLTEDGACGNCFSMVPPQLQQEILADTQLIRCESCGVILIPPLEEEETGDEGAEAETAEAGTAGAETAGDEDADAETAEAETAGA